MRFSVIIPVFNCERSVQNCLQHLLQQTYDDFEIILVDDGSTDNSLAICERMKEIDSRISILNQRNQGAGPARNLGLSVAQGEYILFCDADDFYFYNALEEMNSVIAEKNPDLIIGSYCEFNLIGERIKIKSEKKCITENITDLNKIRENYIRLHKEGMITAPWAKAYKKSILTAHNVEFPKLKRCQDVVYNVSFYSYIKNLSIIGKIIYGYYTPGGNKSVRKYPLDMYDIQKIVYMEIKQRLIGWNVWDRVAEDYFNSLFIHNTMTLFRLNLQNNWNFEKSEKIYFYKRILQDDTLNMIINKPVKNWINELIRLVIKSKHITLINIFNRTICIYQKFKN